MVHLFPTRPGFLLIVIFTLSPRLMAQAGDVNDTARTEIESLLKAKLRSDCGVDGLVNMDRMLKLAAGGDEHVDIFHKDDTGFENPYGTLTHCYVFTYSRIDPRTDAEGKQSVGIFKKGSIIAILDTSIESFASSNGWIQKISDLNKDGEVDIVITRTLGVSPPPWQCSWIISWNGVRLRVINAIDEERESPLVAPWDYMSFVDLDGDGIYELKTDFDDENGVNRVHIYSWDGKLYGEWGQSSKALLKRDSQKKKK
jgi:hypothetical protein